MLFFGYISKHRCKIIFSITDDIAFFGQHLVNDTRRLGLLKMFRFEPVILICICMNFHKKTECLMAILKAVA